MKSDASVFGFTTDLTFEGFRTKCMEHYEGISTATDNPGFPDGGLLKNGIVRRFPGVGPSASSFLRARSV